MEFTIVETMKILTLAFLKMGWMWLPLLVASFMFRSHLNKRIKEAQASKVRIQFDDYTERDII